MKVDVKFVEDVKYRETMLDGKPNIGEQKSTLRPSNKLMETKFGENWLVEQAIELQEKYKQRRASKANEKKKNAAR